jgi:hypothetical protein
VFHSLSNVENRSIRGGVTANETPEYWGKENVNMSQQHHTIRFALAAVLLAGLHSADYAPAFARVQVAETEAPPAVSPRAFLPLVANMLPEPCMTTQSALPDPGLWSFVLNFNKVNTGLPLQGCLMYAEGVTNTRPTIQLFDCFVNDPSHVSFVIEGDRQFARFDGAGYAYCPTFDPPGGGSGTRRERKSLVAVVRPAKTDVARQNPLLFHPFSTTLSSKADIAYDMPVAPVVTGTSVGLVSHHQGTLGSIHSYTSTMGGTDTGWHVLSSDMRQIGNFLVLTHTISTEAGQVKQVFAGRDVLFNFNAITLTIGYNPQTNQYLKGDVDELILDPKRAGAGN